MTAQPKSVIKSYFETGDFPTQAQFVNLIDSYADTSAAVTSMIGDVTAVINNGAATTTISSAAVTSTKIEGRSVSLTKMSFGTVGQVYYCDVSGVPSLLAAGTSGQVLTMGASIPAWTSAAAATGSIANGGYRTNYYYGPWGFGQLTAASLVVSINRLYTVPFIVAQNTTFTRIGIEVQTGAAGSARLGIYNFANGIPTTLVADLGTVTTNVSGTKEITISQNLAAGFYALAVVFSATPTIYSGDDTIYDYSLAAHIFGRSSSGAGTATGGYQAFTFGALPSTYTPGTDLTSPVATPYIWLRVV